MKQAPVTNDCVEFFEGGSDMPGDKTEFFTRKLAATGKLLLTLGGPANKNLVGLGARVVRPTDALD